MLFVVALFVVPALAAFSFQLVCYMNYKGTSSRSPSLKWGQHEGFKNA